MYRTINQPHTQIKTHRILKTITFIGDMSQSATVRNKTQRATYGYANIKLYAIHEINENVTYHRLGK